MVRPSPVPTVDVVLLLPGDRLVLVERKNPPHGWALPGGFVDEGETLEAAAVREAREETGLEVRLLDLVGCYSDPRRDPRRHTITVAFLGAAEGAPRGGDDAAQARAFSWTALPPLCFDHAEILADARRLLLTGARTRPGAP
jgi:8-oxo-dGTP diphosphatase